MNLSEIVIRLNNLASDVRVTEGWDHEGYVNIDLKLADISVIWTELQEELRADPGFACAAIIVCEGRHGWDDYLLLHHFDPLQPIDSLA